MNQSNTQIQKTIQLAQTSDLNVLITGPTGSGKSRLAREIHEKSARKLKPFVILNLATLHEGTLESELFGHERGAYTGADSRRVGRLELAQGGTVFLDEIAELSPRLQARLLEFLQSRTICAVGSNRETRLDVRVIAATHKNLTSAVSRGEFREDLFHRLRVLSISLPSLNQRSDEFGTHVHSTLEEFSRLYGRRLLRLSEAAALRLESHSWPGNFRELRNVLEYAVLASDGTELREEDLPPWFLEASDSASAFAPMSDRSEERRQNIAGNHEELRVADFTFSRSFHEAIRHFEREYLGRALRRHNGRINETARQIGLNKSTLIRRIRALEVVVARKERLPKVNDALGHQPFLA